MKTIPWKTVELATMSACTCGGGVRGDCCPACDVYHALKPRENHASMSMCELCAPEFGCFNGSEPCRKESVWSDEKPNGMNDGTLVDATLLIERIITHIEANKDTFHLPDQIQLAAWSAREIGPRLAKLSGCLWLPNR